MLISNLRVVNELFLEIFDIALFFRNVVLFILALAGIPSGAVSAVIVTSNGGSISRGLIAITDVPLICLKVFVAFCLGGVLTYVPVLLAAGHLIIPSESIPVRLVVSMSRLKFHLLFFLISFAKI